MPNNNENKQPTLISQLFNIGSIPLPEGNKLAIWLLVIVVILFGFFFYFFMNIMDKVVDKALNPDKEKSELVIQEDYNEVLKNSKILKAENQILKDSLDNIKGTDFDAVKQETDSIIYLKTQPYINKLKK